MFNCCSSYQNVYISTNYKILGCLHVGAVIVVAVIADDEKEEKKKEAEEE